MSDISFANIKIDHVLQVINKSQEGNPTLSALSSVWYGAAKHASSQSREWRRKTKNGSKSIMHLLNIKENYNTKIANVL